MHSEGLSKVLQDRYELVEQISSNISQPSQLWIAKNEEQDYYLVKIWKFLDGKQIELQQALWDAELRVMYRVSSSPGAEDSLLVIRDAGLDKKNKCFVMVMESQCSLGYQRLSDALCHRGSYKWLDTKKPELRRDLWYSLRQIAQGIQLLHDQNVLHRTIGAECVFFNSSFGPPSFRLGGFEWSLRVGELSPGSQLPLAWAIPPDVASATVASYRQEDDWYGFGMLAIRTLLNVESLSQKDYEKRHRMITQAIERSNDQQLSGKEKEILCRLIEGKRLERLVRGSDILPLLNEVIESLETANVDALSNHLLLCYSPNKYSFIEAIEEAGFTIGENESFSPHNINHCIYLSDFIREDMEDAQLYFVDSKYILVGQRLSILIDKHNQYEWGAAFCISTWDLRRNEGGTTCRDLSSVTIDVRTIQEISRSPNIIGDVQSWKLYLPYRDSSMKLRTSLTELHNFIRCTNQIELLMRDAELFRYKVIERPDNENLETLVIQEVPREDDRAVLSFLKLEGGLVEFLLREQESAKKYNDYVLLTSEDSLRFEEGIRYDVKDGFQIINIDVDEKIIKLRRVSDGSTSKAPDSGWLRTFGMFGQIALIQRRKGAIDRMEKHSYLLRSLHAPGQLFIDVGDSHPLQNVSQERVDKAKQSIMKDVLRTRPIYALNGPPGTGKTTMVAHLLRQIFVEDPVAQVLITAQAHGAVDVLRDKVRVEAFEDVEVSSQPLSIRLGREYDEGEPVEGSVEFVAKQVLENSVKKLEEKPSLLDIQQQWLEFARETISAISSNRQGEDNNEFVELVKRGANITYCTTSAGDLEELALGTQSFDWTIIEEAGKCHGFDLALPLHVGHRWLMIGDEKQLPPYRLEDYQNSLIRLQDVVDALKKLPKRAGNLLDFEWIDHWQSLDTEAQDRFKNNSIYWLETFKRIRERCKSVLGKETIDEPEGAAAGMLSSQYRMHPTIGTLISEAYYEGKLTNKTVETNGRPNGRVTLSVVKPEEIKGVSIVWLDTPDASKSSVAAEQGGGEKPRYTNQYEVDVIKEFLLQFQLAADHFDTVADDSSLKTPIKLALLSPYNQQVRLLQSELKDMKLPDGITLKETLRGRQTHSEAKQNRIAHTVDSFQGNEADIVVVSLVRNNKGREFQDRPLGFLTSPARMNVLLSRAQRLLVLVGSWSFFYEQVEPFSLKDESRDEWSLKKVITLLSDWFDSKEAIRIDATRFVEISS